MKIAIVESRLGLLDSQTRIPFRYGTACLTRCPQAVLQTVVTCQGRRQAGYSGDCLPPSWFDKSPGKDFVTQIEEMLRVIAWAQEIFATEFAAETEFFSGWLAAQSKLFERATAHHLPPLLASFGSSLLERAILDAICRWHRVPFATAVRNNLFGLRPGEVYPELRSHQPSDWLPPEPLHQVLVRQTIGLGDPLTLADVPEADRLTDGWPQTIEEYVTRRGVRYFKVKVANQPERDLERLRRIAQVVEHHLGANYRVTLDGNEQYHQFAEFQSFVEDIRRDPSLTTFWRNVLVIEQPLERRVALQPAETAGLRDWDSQKPVIIDESDGLWTAYPQALRLGYRGVSSKNCKGTIKSLLHAGLTWLHNQHGQEGRAVMTGEDLCSVGVIPTQADLCLAATLGLEHVERNGHHYHRGLSYLPSEEQRAALAAHPDFYVEESGRIGPRITNGTMQLRSLQCVGFGFAVEPQLAARHTPQTLPASHWG